MLICFIGLDGSGKSSLALATYQELKKSNSKIKITYGRFTPIFSSFIMKIGSRIFLKKRKEMFSDYDNYLTEKKQLFKERTKLVNFYMKILQMDYYFELFFKIILPLKFGSTIIADRYIFDTVINDISIDFDLTEQEINKLIEKFLLIFPKPTHTFYVRVPIEVAFSRKNDIPSLNYLKIRFKKYENIVNEKITIIDGTKDLQELKKIVIDKIDNLR